MIDERGHHIPGRQQHQEGGGYACLFLLRIFPYRTRGFVFSALALYCCTTHTDTVGCHCCLPSCLCVRPFSHLTDASHRIPTSCFEKADNSAKETATCTLLLFYHSLLLYVVLRTSTQVHSWYIRRLHLWQPLGRSPQHCQSVAHIPPQPVHVDAFPHGLIVFRSNITCRSSCATGATSQRRAYPGVP